MSSTTPRPLPSRFRWFEACARAASPSTGVLIDRAIQEARTGFASRPDALIAELRAAGEPRLAFWLRGMTVVDSGDGDFRDGLARAREFLPEYDAPEHRSYSERTCYLGAVASVLAHIDRVGYRDRVHGLREAMLDDADPGDCCRLTVHLTRAGDASRRHDYNEAERLLDAAEAFIQSDASGAEALAHARFRLDLARTDLDSAAARLERIEAERLRPDLSARELRRRLAERKLLRCELAMAHGASDEALAYVEAALWRAPVICDAPRVALELLELLHQHDMDDHALRLAALATDVATRRGLARTEVELRLAWCRLARTQADSGQQAATALAGIEDAAARLASHDLNERIREALGTNTPLPARAQGTFP